MRNNNNTNNNTQRRIFRGRGGPTDRRLPKHNARRRRQPPPPYRDIPRQDDDDKDEDDKDGDEEEVVEHKEEAKQQDVIARDIIKQQHELVVVVDTDTADLGTNRTTIAHQQQQHQQQDDDDDDDVLKSPRNNIPKQENEEETTDLDTTRDYNNDTDELQEEFLAIVPTGATVDGHLSVPSQDDDEEEEERMVINDANVIEKMSDYKTQEYHHDDVNTVAAISIVVDDTKMHVEIQHLMKRIKHNRKSFSITKEGLSSIDSYQMNVLHAVKNCVNEWKGILNHYKPPTATSQMVQEGGGGGEEEAAISSSHGENHSAVASTATTNPVLRQTGQALFELIQQAMQCGPLSGSKPGYFKRCGSQVATIVHAFLCQIIATSQEARALFLTEKQATVVETWKMLALKAAKKRNNNKNQPATKFVLQKQAKAEKQRKAKNEKQNEKQKESKVAK